jgi:hypothetical protein
MTPKAKLKKEKKINQLNFIKNKNVCLSKISFKTMTIKSTDRKNI